MVTGASNSCSGVNLTQEVSFKKCENIAQSENNEEESRDVFPSDLKIRRLVLNALI